MTIKDKWIQFKFQIFDFIHNDILHEEHCDYCWYFGGLMCDHVDNNDKCLGFKRYTLKDKIIGERTQRKFYRTLNRAFRKKYGRNWKKILKDKYGR